MTADAATVEAGAPAQPLATTLEFGSAEALAAALRSASVEYTSLTAGPYRASLTLMDLPGIRLQQAIDAPHLTRGAVAPGEHLVLMPLSASTQTRFNGREVASHDAILLSPGSDVFASVGSRLTWGSVSLGTQTIAALELAVPQQGRFRNLPGVLARCPSLAPMIRAALAAGQAPGAITAGSAAAAAMADDIREVVRAALEGPGARDDANRAARRQIALVRQADDYLFAHLGRPVGTSEICAALGVSDRSLRAAFGAVYGISLHAYLRMRRLDRVRDWLLRTPRAYGRVKAAALSHGFWHLGRFAAEYQARFGEQPSRTGPVVARSVRGTIAARAPG